MINFPDGVWTETDAGWVMRQLTPDDAKRRSLLRAWQRGDLIRDEFTHMDRPMSYSDVMKEVRAHGITAVGCAA